MTCNELMMNVMMNTKKVYEDPWTTCFLGAIFVEYYIFCFRWVIPVQILLQIFYYKKQNKNNTITTITAATEKNNNNNNNDMDPNLISSDKDP